LTRLKQEYHQQKEYCDMRIYPAIDIKDGNCVRLRQGDSAKEDIYGKDPAAMAVKWRDMGAKRLHVVDLDGAFGKGKNIQALREITNAVDIPVQTGGGIRTLEDIEERLEAGAKRVIIGTAAVENPELVKSAAKKFPGSIAVGIDARNGIVFVKGWVESGGISAVSLALDLREYIDTIIYTDIAKDGMLEGPNIGELKQMIELGGLKVIASGGVSSAKDLKLVYNAGADGVIIGKALYENKLSLEEAIAWEENL
jgi:phosphoribosylformimino-5-aminoimidazole carboxamide ribotide isomerase